MAEYARFIRRALGRTRGRELVPSLAEISALSRRQELLCTVHCPGAGACPVAIDSHTMAGEVRPERTPETEASQRPVPGFPGVPGPQVCPSLRVISWVRAACGGTKRPERSLQLNPSRSTGRPPARSEPDFPLMLPAFQVARELVGRLGLTRSRNTFALYEQRGAQERALAGATVVADVLTRFEK